MLNIILDKAFYEWKRLMSNADFILVLYYIFEIMRSGNKEQIFSSTEVLDELGYSKQAQTKALEVAAYYDILEFEVLPSKGRNVKIGKELQGVLDGE